MSVNLMPAAGDHQASSNRITRKEREANLQCPLPFLVDGHIVHGRTAQVDRILLDTTFGQMLNSRRSVLRSPSVVYTPRPISFAKMAGRVVAVNDTITHVCGRLVRSPIPEGWVECLA